MYKDLKDKHVLITGGSKGIGYACARAFLQSEARVTIVSRNQLNLDEAQNSLKSELGQDIDLISISCDLTVPDDAKKSLDLAKDKFSQVDVLINSAGAAKRATTSELNPNVWMAAMQSKYFSYINMIDPVVKDMANQKSGVIVNIIGIGGKVANPIHLAGGAANSALMLVTTGLATAYASNNVRINAINPGMTYTERLKGRIDAEARQNNLSSEDVLRASMQKIPMKRFAYPNEIANVALFLSSEQASYVTGQIIGMEGGAYPII